MNIVQCRILHFGKAEITTVKGTFTERDVRDIPTVKVAVHKPAVLIFSSRKIVNGIVYAFKKYIFSQIDMILVDCKNSHFI